MAEFKNVEVDYNKQDDVVKTYFEKICRDDPYGLSLDGFFQRVCTSIDINGLKSTCSIYDLDEAIVSKIKL